MCRRPRFWALAAVSLGLLIILAVILPAEFWWLILAAGLICIGIRMLRC